MGKGDKRSKKGKIFKGSYGKVRPHKSTKYASGREAASAKENKASSKE